MKLEKAVAIAKKNAIAGKYKLKIMTGNIANPNTYEWICNFNDNSCICKYDWNISDLFFGTYNL